MRQCLLRTIQLAFIFALFTVPVCVYGQSLAVGAGFGFPLMNYFTGQTGREYRITPEPGYYAVLKDYENSLWSVHLNASLLLEFELPVDIEIRFDATQMRWKKSHTTHVSCKPIDVVNGEINDAIAQYYALDSLPDETCINRSSYKTDSDLSDSSLAKLWFFHISGGVRYNFLEKGPLVLFGGGHLGLTIASQIEGNTWLGGNVDAMLGIVIKITERFWAEMDARLMFLVTQVPQDTQTRINHETQTGGNIFTSLVQPDAYVDIQFSIRFDLSTL